jgi:hypothetical protein
MGAFRRWIRGLGGDIDAHIAHTTRVKRLADAGRRAAGPKKIKGGSQ